MGVKSTVPVIGRGLPGRREYYSFYIYKKGEGEGEVQEVEEQIIKGFDTFWASLFVRVMGGGRDLILRFVNYLIDLRLFSDCQKQQKKKKVLSTLQG